MGVSLRSTPLDQAKADVAVVGLRQVNEAVEIVSADPPVTEAFVDQLAPLLASGVRATLGEITKIPAPPGLPIPVLVLVGLGPDDTYDTLRKASAQALRAVTDYRKVWVSLPHKDTQELRALVEGLRLGGYEYTRYKKSSSKTTSVVVRTQQPAAQNVLMNRVTIESEAVRETRTWVNDPPNVLNPVTFSQEIVAKAENLAAQDLKVEVWDEQRLTDEGCGGILGVGQSSHTPPQLVLVTYQPKRANHHIALVGKGITFDSGGLTIKPASGMPTMKCDMAGAASVVSATFAAAELGLPVKITTVVALAENMVSGRAMRPGDILTTRSGTTVEIQNTDAEGRLVLADALDVACSQNPDTVVDVATLTGHMVVALGDKVGGVMGNDEIVRALVEAGQRVGETHWPMPIPAEMEDRITSSKVADLSQHDWVRWGGGLFAAAFLRKFTQGIPWAHLDIAGPAFNSGSADGYWTAGGTGFSVTTLIEYLHELSKNQS
jgi:leucyl aminopeptidase